MIPMVDLRKQYQELRAEMDAELMKVLDSTRFILGPNVNAFENETADYLGVAHTIGCASGTDALHLALVAAGIGPGDEVITTAFTFIATAEAIRYTGATPVFVDISPETFNIDPDAVQKAISPATRAVLTVHLFGNPADMVQLGNICQTHGLTLIEDCAQSFGARFENQHTGSFGSFGCFSFFPSKNLGCYGDGGMVSCNSKDLAAKLRMLRNHGSREQYRHEVIGFNSRLDELQAAILRVKLKRIDHYNEQRRRVAHRYNQLLCDTSVITPMEMQDSYHVYHQYTILSDQRDRIMAHLREAEIASAVYYPIPLHQQQAFAQQAQGLSLPVTEQVSRQCLSLPIYPELCQEDIDQVGAVIRQTA